MQNRSGLRDKLKVGVYARQALVPESPWLGSTPPAKPALKVRVKENGLDISWSYQGKGEAWQWVVSSHRNDEWLTEIRSGLERSYHRLPGDKFDTIAVYAVNRCGLMSAPVIWSSESSHKVKPKL